MKIARVVLLPDYEEKIVVKHAINADEVHEVFAGSPRFRFAEVGRRSNEHMYAALGQTDSGRYLIVFFLHKVSGDALVVSAREMESKERKNYERK